MADENFHAGALKALVQKTNDLRFFFQCPKNRLHLFDIGKFWNRDKMALSLDVKFRAGVGKGFFSEQERPTQQLIVQTLDPFHLEKDFLPNFRHRHSGKMLIQIIMHPIQFSLCCRPIQLKNFVFHDSRRGNQNDENEISFLSPQTEHVEGFVLRSAGPYIPAWFARSATNRQASFKISLMSNVPASTRERISICSADVRAAEAS